MRLAVVIHGEYHLTIWLVCTDILFYKAQEGKSRTIYYTMHSETLSSLKNQYLPSVSTCSPPFMTYLGR